MADVTLQVAGDSERAQQELVKLEKKLVKMTSQVEAMGKKSKKAAAESNQGFKSLNQQMKDIGNSIQKSAVRLFAWQKGYEMVTAAARKLLETQKQINVERNKAGSEGNEQSLKMMIQAGLTNQQARERYPAMRAMTLLTPSVENAGEMYQMQTQLFSSGFNPQDMESGRALLAALNLKAATNQFGKDTGDVREMILSISQFRKAMGDESPSADSIESTGGKLTQLFEGSDIQFPDLKELAKVASSLKGLNIDENQQLAAFSALVDIKGGAEASTGLRQVGARLRGAAGFETKTKALESLNLKPEDVDLVGEDFITALERLQSAASKVDEKTRSIAFLKLFEEQGFASAEALLTQLPTVKKRMGILEGGAYERNVEMFRSSPYAIHQRFKLRKEFADYERVVQGGQWTNEMAADQLRAQSAERALNRPHTKSGAMGNALDRAWIEGGITIGQSISGQPSDLVDVPVPEAWPAAAKIPEKDMDLLLETLKEGNGLSKEMIEEMKQIKNGQFQMKMINRNAHTEK